MENICISFNSKAKNFHIVETILQIFNMFIVAHQTKLNLHASSIFIPALWIVPTNYLSLLGKVMDL